MIFYGLAAGLVVGLFVGWLLIQARNRLLDRNEKGQPQRADLVE